VLGAGSGFSVPTSVSLTHRDILLFSASCHPRKVAHRCATCGERFARKIPRNSNRRSRQRKARHCWAETTISNTRLASAARADRANRNWALYFRLRKIELPNVRREKRGMPERNCGSTRSAAATAASNESTAESCLAN